MTTSVIKTIGEVTALIPEASTANDASELLDGKSGDIDFPYAQFKAIATIGEVDPTTKKSADRLAGWQRSLAEGRRHGACCLPVRILRHDVE